MRPDGSLLGTNNDGYGFIESLLEADPDWRAEAGPIVVMGAGGGSRAVIDSLAERGAREIRLLNRTPERAPSAGAGIRRADHGAALGGAACAALDGAAMLVNTTSQGMVGEPPLDLDLDKLPTSALVADIVYIPRETPLLAAARARGNRTVNGLGMLLHQARPAWKAWFGIDTEVTPELRALHRGDDVNSPCVFLVRAGLVPAIPIGEAQQSGSPGQARR